MQSVRAQTSESRGSDVQRNDEYCIMRLECAERVTPVFSQKRGGRERLSDYNFLNSTFGRRFF